MVGVEARLITPFGEIRMSLVVEYSDQVTNMVIAIANCLRCDIICVTESIGHTVYSKFNWNKPPNEAS